jgi:hypothetical protein
MTSPAPSMPAWLINEGTGIAFDLADAQTTIGRDPRNDVLVHDATVSRFHAEVRRDGEQWTLHVNGTTGAEVNDARVDGPRTLLDGDRIGVGTNVLRFHRGALPSDVQPYGGHEQILNDPAMLNPTATLPAVRVRPRNRSSGLRPFWILVGLVAVVAAVAIYQMIRSR